MRQSEPVMPKIDKSKVGVPAGEGVGVAIVDSVIDATLVDP
jgi:hypothetical protein